VLYLYSVILNDHATITLLYILQNLMTLSLLGPCKIVFISWH